MLIDYVCRHLCFVCLLVSYISVYSIERILLKVAFLHDLGLSYRNGRFNELHFSQ